VVDVYSASSSVVVAVDEVLVADPEQHKSMIRPTPLFVDGSVGVGVGVGVAVAAVVDDSDSDTTTAVVVG